MLTGLRAQLPLWRRALRRRRRPLGLLLAAALLVAVLPGLLPPSARGAVVVVARTELAAGSTLTAQDLAEVRIAEHLVPADASATAEDLVGRTTAIALPGGTPILPGMLEDGATASIPAGSALMAVPVPSVMTARLTPGTRVELLATGADPSAGTAVDGVVVQTLGGVDDAGGGFGGIPGASAQSLVLVPRATSGDLAHALLSGAVTVTIVE